MVFQTVKDYQMCIRDRYRAEHTKIRNTEADLMQIYKRLTYSYAKDEDIKRENANIDADTAMGTMLKYGSEGSKYFIDNYVPVSYTHLDVYKRQTHSMPSKAAAVAVATPC